MRRTLSDRSNRRPLVLPLSDISTEPSLLIHAVACRLLAASFFNRRSAFGSLPIIISTRATGTPSACAQLELKLNVAKFDPVAILQRSRLDDGVIDKGFVEGIQIGDCELTFARLMYRAMIA